MVSSSSGQIASTDSYIEYYSYSTIPKAALVEAIRYSVLRIAWCVVSGGLDDEITHPARAKMVP